MIINRNLRPVGFNQQRRNQSFYISNPPNFGVGGIPTQGGSNKSDAELKTAIEEMAKKHFAALERIAPGSTQQGQNSLNVQA